MDCARSVRDLDLLVVMQHTRDIYFCILTTHHKVDCEVSMYRTAARSSRVLDLLYSNGRAHAMATFQLTSADSVKMSKLEELQNAHAALLEERKEREKSITESGDTLQKFQTTIMNLKTEITTLKDQTRSRMQQDQHSFNQLEMLEAEIELLRIATMSEDCMYSVDINEAKARVTNFTEQSQRARAAILTEQSQRIHNVENRMIILTKQNEQLQLQNEALRKANEVLELKNKLLWDKISTLEKQIDDLTVANHTLTIRVSALETNISQLETSGVTLQTDRTAQKDSFTTQDVMRDLEFFICREACLKFNITPTQMKKRKLYCFQSLRHAKPPVPLPDWLQHGDVDVCAQIKDFKDNANCVVHVRPLTDDAVQKTIAEDDDDDEDTEAKNLMISKLRQYYQTEGTAFGVEPKRY
eukprot:m.106254 g.106254  ORF g.106254 m.106254 type:complete len:413 (-) comp27708_c0_seq2:60-1298(-)